MHFDVIISYRESFPPQVEGVPRLSCKVVMGSSSVRERRRNGQRDSWWTGLPKMSDKPIVEN